MFGRPSTTLAGPPFCRRALRLSICLVAAALACNTLSAQGLAIFRHPENTPSAASLQTAPFDTTPDGRIVDYSHPPRTSDGVRILSITPAPLGLGSPLLVTVRVSYCLISVPKAVVGIGFNSRGPTKFVLLSDRWIERGRGEIELTAWLQPVDWADRHAMKACATLAIATHPTAADMLASEARELK